jgi:uncharacterized protein
MMLTESNKGFIFNRMEKQMNRLALSEENIKSRISPYSESLAHLCKKFPIKKLYLFGSILRSDFDTTSDIDFQIEFDSISIESYFDIYFDIKFELEKIVGRKIDLIDLDELNNQRLKKNIESSRLVIYAA